MENTVTGVYTSLNATTGVSLRVKGGPLAEEAARLETRVSRRLPLRERPARAVRIEISS